MEKYNFWTQAFIISITQFIFIYYRTVNVNKEWNSLKEAEEFFNKKGAIGNCIRRGFNYNSCGYKWKYK